MEKNRIVLKWKRDYNGYLYILPAVIAIVALIIYPMGYGLYLSFYNTNLVNRWNFVGLRYYTEAFSRPELYNSVLLTFKFMFFVVLGHFLLGFILATILNKKFKGRTFFRVLFTLPWLFPETVIALLFTWIFNPMYGLLNDVLKYIGIIDQNISWLGTAKYAFPMVVIVSIWKGYPLVMTMLLSGMQSIAGDLYEAAKIDGANGWQRFWNITLPGLWPVFATTLILDTVWWFKQYTMVFTMTNGGPGTATNLISLNIYNTAFSSMQFGKASAWGLIVFIIVFLMSKVFRFALRVDREDE